MGVRLTMKRMYVIFITVSLIMGAIMGNFKYSLAFTLEREGGFINHPNDPGGATNKGITQFTFDNYNKLLNHPLRSVKTITDSEVESIYEKMYWNKINGDKLPQPLDVIVFDTAVNIGPAKALMLLERIKAATLSHSKIFGWEELCNLPHTEREPLMRLFVFHYLNERRNYYHNLVKQNSKFDVFLKGWLSRTKILEEHANTILNKEGE